MWDSNITLAIVGSGPLEREIKNRKSKIKNLIFLGKVDNDKLPLYYSAADLTIVPSIHEEGFGRVILESLACGTPVIAANRGAIPEAMDETVGKIIKVTPENIKFAVELLHKDTKLHYTLSKNSRVYARKHYSQNNLQDILQIYNRFRSL